MSFADNWARIFVVITFLSFGEAQIIGGIVPNVIAFLLFIGAICYFAFTRKMAEIMGLKKTIIATLFRRSIKPLLRRNSCDHS